jgi:hypothetical protein
MAETDLFLLLIVLILAHSVALVHAFAGQSAEKHFLLTEDTTRLIMLINARNSDAVSAGRARFFP